MLARLSAASAAPVVERFRHAGSHVICLGSIHGSREEIRLASRFRRLLRILFLSPLLRFRMLLLSDSSFSLFLFLLFLRRQRVASPQGDFKLPTTV
jgi:hypothetical protein